MGSIFGGDGGSKSGTSGMGLSGADLAMVEQALGLGTESIHNRYRQLGIGQPSGDPIQAAASGQSLNYAGPSTMETQDIQGLGQMAQAALGTLQNKNVSNPAIPGSVANQGQNISQLGQLASNTGFNDNLRGGNVNQTPDVSSG